MDSSSQWQQDIFDTHFQNEGRWHHQYSSLPCSLTWSGLWTVATALFWSSGILESCADWPTSNQKTLHSNPWLLVAVGLLSQKPLLKFHALNAFPQERQVCVGPALQSIFSSGHYRPRTGSVLTQYIQGNNKDKEVKVRGILVSLQHLNSEPTFWYAFLLLFHAH